MTIISGSAITILEGVVICEIFRYKYLNQIRERTYTISGLATMCSEGAVICEIFNSSLCFIGIHGPGYMIERCTSLARVTSVEFHTVDGCRFDLGGRQRAIYPFGRPVS